MKLKNKKTGEIVEGTDILALMATGDDLSLPVYRSLAELNEEWEDYEEPKEYWYIDSYEGTVIEKTEEFFNLTDKERKEIGNYFETREEAEKAVEKLKAWKRLKDKGFRFEGWDNTDRSTIHNFSLFVAIEDLENINKDLDLLFGGEE